GGRSMSWSELPGKLKAYIVFLTLLATPIAIWATGELYVNAYDRSWLILAGLALATIPFFLFFPSKNATVSIGDTYIMAIAMMYGIAPCLITTFCHTLLTSIFAPRPERVHPYRVVFNISSTLCVAFLYSS